MTSIEDRLTALEDRLAILDLEGEYARSWDVGDAAGWADVFTPEGVFDLAPAGDMERQVFKGRQALHDFCEEISRYYRGLHFISLPRVEIGRDRARAQVHFQWQALFRPNGNHSGERHASGYYDVTYRKLDGRWRIEQRIECALAGKTLNQYGAPQPVDLSVTGNP